MAIWAVEDTALQIAWGQLPAGLVTVAASVGAAEVARPVAIDHAGGPGVVDVKQLPPGTEVTVVVNWPGGRRELTATTLVPPPGEELGRLATISDLHLGSDHFGFLKQMREHGEEKEPFAFRSAEAAIGEAIDWGATRLIVKGDAAHHGRAEDFDMVGRLLDSFPGIPVNLLPGNHDVDFKGGAQLPDGVGSRQIRYVRTTDHLDLPGLRLVLGNTTIERHGIGTLRVVGSELLERAGSSDRPVLMAVHQQLQQHNTTRHWPPGIKGSEARPFLDQLGAVNRQALVTTGHTHRNRARRDGTTLLTEVGSTHHWPGVWAGYVIHEGGIRQVVRRIGAPSVVPWHEYSKNAVLTVWQRYAPGPLDQRCLAHTWPT